MTIIIKDKVKDQIVITDQKEIESQRFVESTGVHKGHTIYEFDKTTGKLNEAEFESSDITFNADPTKRHTTHKLVMRKDCLYVSALNMKNAFRKLNKHIKGNVK